MPLPSYSSIYRVDPNKTANPSPSLTTLVGYTSPSVGRPRGLVETESTTSYRPHGIVMVAS